MGLEKSSDSLKISFGAMRKLSLRVGLFSAPADMSEDSNLALFENGFIAKPLRVDLVQLRRRPPHHKNVGPALDLGKEVFPIIKVVLRKRQTLEIRDAAGEKKIAIERISKLDRKI